MFRVVRIKDNSGAELPVFVGCSETGYSVKDVLTMPGAYEECVSSIDGNPMVLQRLNGTIGSYHTECFGLVVIGDAPAVMDLTGEIARFLTMPPTAVSAMMQAMSPQLREDIKQAMDSVHYCESVKEDTKVCLPDEALSGLDEATAKSMQSARQAYTLRSTENQEIFQKACDAEYCIQLPKLEEIHSEDGFPFNTLDILRVTMPYRRPDSPPVYEPIYHTPYYKVGNQRGMVPSHLQWIDGYSSNDLLDIQPNERHMQRNLYMLYQSDVARYVAEMVTGVLFNTEFGSRLTKLRYLSDRDAIDRLVSEIRLGGGFEGGPGVSCPLSTTDVEELWANDWDPGEVGRRVKERLTFDDGFLEAMVEAQHQARRVVTTTNLILTVTLTDAQEQYFTEQFIKKGFITHELHEFFLRLCQRAYEVNWGHTGSARAIPLLVSLFSGSTGDELSRSFTQYLQAKSAGRVLDEEERKKSLLYRGTHGDPSRGVELSDDEGDFVQDTSADDGDEVTVAFDYYITKTTAGRMRAGEVDYDTLYGVRDDESEADRRTRLERTQDSDASKIERWRIVNGNNNLVYFLTGAYLRTADVNIYIQSFIKLLRWGERRPKVLALADHPEIRVVFDLCNGEEGDNTAIVDESQLVKVNGCDYSFKGFLASTTNNDINPNHIVGFLLEKNYGTVVKTYLASWEDIGEMAESGNINIGEFKTGAVVNTDPATFTSIESFEKRAYEIYESDSSIEEGIKLKVRGRELSKIVLLTRPQIMSERSYIRSTMNNTLITLNDKQYDNLRRYSENLRRFYGTYNDKLNNINTTLDLQELSILFLQLAKTGATPKQEHNAQVAANTASKMTLDFGTGDGEVQYDESPLEGKFVLVLDGHNLTIQDDTWEPIKFVDPQLVRLAARPGVSIVLLLLKTRDCWLLCRRGDIAPSAVDILRTPTGSKINCVQYSKLRDAANGLLKGISQTYEGLPLKLHVSAKLPVK